MRSISIVWIAALLFGCGSSTSGGRGVPAGSALSLSHVPFETSSDPLGHAAAAVDVDGGAVVFSDLGAVVLTAGVVSSTDGSVKTWRAAATIPAPDGTAPWVVGIDAAGHVQHLRGRLTLEDATDRWALTDVHVTSVASLGPSSVAFGFTGGFAVADGTKVTRYAAPAFSQLVGGGGRVAAIDGASVTVFEMTTGAMSSYAVPGVVAIAIADDGTLLAASNRSVYVERTRGFLDVVYQSPDLDIRTAVASGTRFWLALGTELITLASTDGFSVSRSSGAGLDPAATLMPGASSSVWTLAAGTLGKVTIAGSAGDDPDAGASDRLQWQTTIEPVFGRVCSACHLPGGSAGYDLSTYDAWITLAPQIKQRVVVRGDMPPKGTTLSDADRATIADWLTKHGQ